MGYSLCSTPCASPQSTLIGLPKTTIYIIIYLQQLKRVSPVNFLSAKFTVGTTPYAVLSHVGFQTLWYCLPQQYFDWCINILGNIVLHWVRDKRRLPGSCNYSATRQRKHLEWKYHAQTPIDLLRPRSGMGMPAWNRNQVSRIFIHINAIRQ